MVPRKPAAALGAILSVLVAAGRPEAQDKSFGSALPALAQDKKDDFEPIKADEKAGTVSFGAKVAKLEVYPQLKGAIEYLITMPGGKEYESVFSAPLNPVKLFEAMKKAGMTPGKPAGEDDNGKKVPPSGAKIRIWVEWNDGDKDRREPAETFVLDVTTGKPMEQKPWIFTGSREGYDPVQDKMVIQAVVTKNLVSLYHNDATVLVQPSFTAKDEHEFKGNKSALPKEGTRVRIVFEPVK